MTWRQANELFFRELSVLSMIPGGRADKAAIVEVDTNRSGLSGSAGM